MNPFLLPKAAIAIVRFGFGLWVRLLGKKAMPVVAALTALSTLAVLVIEGCDLA